MKNQAHYRCEGGSGGEAPPVRCARYERIARCNLKWRSSITRHFDQRDKRHIASALCQVQTTWPIVTPVVNSRRGEARTRNVRTGSLVSLAAAKGEQFMSKRARQEENEENTWIRGLRMAREALPRTQWDDVTDRIIDWGMQQDWRGIWDRTVGSWNNRETHSNTASAMDIDAPSSGNWNNGSKPARRRKHRMPKRHHKRHHRHKRRKRRHQWLHPQAVINALNKLQPKKKLLHHVTQNIACTQGAQGMQMLGAVMLVTRPASDALTNYPAALDDMFAFSQLIIQSNAAYTTGSILTNKAIQTSKIEVIRQKANFIFTNMTTATVFCELYLFYAKDTTETGDFSAHAALTTSANYQVQSTAYAGSNAITAVTAATPGVTPFDNYVLRKAFKIKRLGKTRRLDPGDNAEFTLKSKKPYWYTPADSTQSGVQTAYAKGHTKFLGMRIWGEPITVTGGSTVSTAACKINYVATYKTWFQFQSDLLSDPAMLSADAATGFNPTGTAPLTVADSNAGASGTITGLTVSTI